MLHKLHILHLWSLLILIGCTHCELRRCTEEEVENCMTLAIRSYMRNTQGEEAANGPLDGRAGRLVTAALETSLHSNPREFYTACTVLSEVDMRRVTQCMDDLNKYCTREVPQDHYLVNETLPSIRLFPLNKMPSLLVMICKRECNFFTLRKAITTMLNCYTRAPLVVDRAEEDNLMKNDCRLFQRYIECQWNNSAGLDTLETITRHYFGVLKDSIDDCVITLPPAAFGDTTITNTGGSPRPSLLLQATAAVMCGIMSQVSVAFRSNKGKFSP